MFLRSGRPVKLNFSLLGTPHLPPITSTPTVGEQKIQQEAEKAKTKMAENIASLSQCCQRAHGKIQRVRQAIEAANLEYDKFSIHALKLYKKTVESAYEEYNDYLNKIYLVDPTRKAEFEPKFVEFEELYEFTCIALCEMIEDYEELKKTREYLRKLDAPAEPARTETRFSPTIVLQQAALPTFDGKYEHWFKFKQMFRDIADKCTADSAATKLHYLDKALVGKAQGAIDAQIIRDNDYEGAWRSLTQQFENLPALINDTIIKLLHLKPMTCESFQQLKVLIDDVDKCVSSLDFHGLKMDKLSEAILTTLISTKLDVDTRKLWESNVKRGKLPVYKDMMTALRDHLNVLERCENAKGSKTRNLNPPSRNPQTATSKAHTVTTQRPDDACPLCSEKHLADKCDAFKSLDVKQRYDKAKQLGLCFMCLKKGHRTSNCKATAKCAKCSKRHNSLMHPEENTTEKTSTVPVQPTVGDGVDGAGAKVSSSEMTVAKCSFQCNEDVPNHVILATAMVNVYDVNGVNHRCRVLLDSGAMANFVSQSLADFLRLKKQTADLPILGVNGMKSTVKFKVHAKVKSVYSDYEFCLDYLVVPRVTGTLPQSRLDVDNWPIPTSLRLADPMFYEPAHVDLLVGAEAFFEIMRAGKIRMSNDLPLLQESRLGWLIVGRVNTTAQVASVRVLQATVGETNEELVRLMKKFWSIDDQSTEVESPEDDCEKHFVETHSRTADGRYKVRLPFKKDAGELGETRSTAENRFYQLERRLMKNTDQQRLYAQFMEEYIKLGHCRIVDAPEASSAAGYYLPHHSVVRPDSSTTRLRVVFDASMKSSSGNSLNDLLMIGPPVQDPLFDIMLRFRLHKYVFTADVLKMYRQILIHEDDTKYQKVLYRTHDFEPLKELELTTVTYGTAAAPFLATRVLKQLADDEQVSFPRASKIVKKCFYVDDVLCGAETLDEAKEIQQELQALLAKGGFQMHKWCANDAELLKDIPIELREKQMDFLNHDINETIKTLGLCWNPVGDNFFFQIKPKDGGYNRVTKRQVMSDIAKLYDPLGLLGPTVVIAKLIMQDLWKIGLHWDEPLADTQLVEWTKLRKELPEIAERKILRRVTTDEADYLEVHGFSDASKKAFGCCVYIRSVPSRGPAILNLLCAKSRVAPLKVLNQQKEEDEQEKDSTELTTPRLELCAALLLAQQITRVVNALEIDLHRVVLWSDSTIVLGWIESMKPDIPIFIRNRVMQIRELTGKFEWKYVPTSANPADLISRGLYPKQLIKSDMWWGGPVFLRSNDGETVLLSLYEAVDGQPGDQVAESSTKVVAATTVPENEVLKVILSCSDYRKLERIFGFVMRFIGNCRVKCEDRRRGQLNREDYQAAQYAMVKVVQSDVYHEEINCVKKNKPVKGKLGNLKPELDQATHLLRVGGRIRHADLPEDQKHPLIIPENHHFTKILIEALHCENLHVGSNGLLAIIRKSFWPVNAKRSINRVLRHCVKCFRVKPKETEQHMGDLPKFRVTAADPFSRTGVDYAGPVFLKQGRLRAPVKGYIVLFVCMCTKAIHIELVTSMTTDSFLAALQRFVGRRGNVCELFSDNGKNFVGAQRQLKELCETLNSQQLKKGLGDFCQARGITWNFNPPKAPHQGGLWEAGVKSAKYHLHRVLNESNLTYEEMNTLLIQIEAVLNSRPLCQQSNDPLDYRALSPGHFLIGRELTAIPEPLYHNVKDNALSRYRIIQKRQQSFWERWSNEYLTGLQQRGKWFKTPSDIRIGMMVVLKEDNTPPKTWKLGRITATHAGKDGIIRVVNVQTATGEYCRPTTQIVILPIADNEDKQ